MRMKLARFTDAGMSATGAVLQLMRQVAQARDGGLYVLPVVSIIAACPVLRMLRRAR